RDHQHGCSGQRLVPVAAHACHRLRWTVSKTARAVVPQNHHGRGSTPAARPRPDLTGHTTARWSRGPGSRFAIMALTTSFTELVGCQVPIQLAPMGPVSPATLAAWVADAGVVGSVTGQWLSAAEVDAMLAGIAEQTTGVVAANFMTEDIDREAVEAAAARVRIVDFFWADPDPALVDLVHRNRALACWQVGSVEEARDAAEAGGDAIAVQGTGGGGHIRGQASLLPLLESVVGEFDLPVLAAGGIGGGRAFAEVLERGAAGARVGTRFVATDESGAHPAY